MNRSYFEEKKHKMMIVNDKYPELTPLLRTIFNNLDNGISFCNQRYTRFIINKDLNQIFEYLVDLIIGEQIFDMPVILLITQFHDKVLKLPCNTEKLGVDMMRLLKHYHKSSV